jgi:hypothetical protein
MEVTEVGEVDSEGVGDCGDATMDFFGVVFRGDDKDAAGIRIVPEPWSRGCFRNPQLQPIVVLPPPPSPERSVTARSGIMSGTIQRRGGGRTPAKDAAEMTVNAAGDSGSFAAPLLSSASTAEGPDRAKVSVLIKRFLASICDWP